MAKVIIEYDTETNKASITIDGKELANVSGVSMYSGCCSEEEGEMYMNISTMEKDEKAGLNKSTNYYSMASASAKAVSKKNAIASLPGFVGVKSSDEAVESIARFFEQKLLYR